MADDAKGSANTRQNLALTGLAATILMRYLETHYQVKISADDAMEYISGGLVAWHFIVTTCGPYTGRIFDHFFPPPAVPPAQKE